MMQDRRDGMRPVPPSPGVAVKFRMLLKHVVKFFSKGWSGVLFVVLVMLFSGLTVWWSLNSRMNIIDINNAAIEEIIQLESEVNKLKRDWSDDRYEELTDAVSVSEQQVFSGYRRLAKWLYKETNLAAEEGIVMNYNFGDTYGVEGLEGIVAVPVTFDLKIEKTHGDNGYRVLLEHLNKLGSKQGQHNVVSATMDSQGRGALEMKAQLDVWMWAPEEFDDESQNYTDMMDTVSLP